MFTDFFFKIIISPQQKGGKRENEKHEGIIFFWALRDSPIHTIAIVDEELTIYHPEDGDELTVFNNNGSIVFKGIIEKEYLKEEEKYECGLWWCQKGFTPEKWFKLCDESHRAELIVR